MLLEIQDLVKEYAHGFRANDGISLEIAAGEVFGLLGPNGAGKSTLVKQVVGLLRPDHGRIVLGGVDVTQRPEHARRAVSFQPQTNVPIDGFTPVQAVELIGRLRGGEAGRVKARGRELLDALELGEWDGRQGQHLSGGVRRLVGFCMAAVVPGDLVILDEPTNDVDPLRRRHLWREIRRLSEAGAAVLLVTHNVLEAERAVDRLAVIDQGRVLDSGSPATLKGVANGSLRLELVLEPGADLPPTPWSAQVMQVGRRFRTTVESERVGDAVEWARGLQAQGRAEEFSVSPVSLEDVYVRMIGRPDVLDDDDLPAPAAADKRG